MREKFLSLNDISKKQPGFQFYTKDALDLIPSGYLFLELVSVKKEMIPVAYGFLGDMYQEKITISVMTEKGEIRKEHNLTNKTNGGDIFNIAYIKKDWDKLDYITKEAFLENKKQKYTDYLKEEVKNGNITELDMYKMLSEV